MKLFLLGGSVLGELDKSRDQNYLHFNQNGASDSGLTN